MWSLYIVLAIFFAIDIASGYTNDTYDSADNDGTLTISVNLNQTKLDCGDIFVNQTVDDSESLTYYEITVDEDLETPSTIIACHPLSDDFNINDTDFKFYIHLFKQIGSTQTIISHPIEELINTPQCNGYGLQIDLTSFVETKQYGTYFIAVENSKATFSIEMICGMSSGTVIGDVTMLVIVLSVVTISVIIFCCFYCYQVKRLKKRYHKTIDDEDNGDSTDSKEDCGGSIDREPDNKLVIDLEHGDRNNHINDFEEDPVIKVMQDILKSVEDKDGLDIYQVLAFRAKDKRSRSMKLKQPFSKLKLDMNILYLSSFQRVFYVAIIAFSLQVIGITVILYSVTFHKFREEGLHCYYNVDDWEINMNWIYKILAFLWASVITLSIGIHKNKIHDSGFNKIIDRIPNKMYNLFDCVDIVVLHLGLLSNLYTLLIAVIGSYFIILTSPAGAEAMEMVLNAVALFFMIELDDLLVTKNDYRDVEEGCNLFLQNYINQKKQNKPRQRYREYFKAQLCGIKGMSRLTKIVESFGSFIAVITCFLGFVAPILILICYQGFPENS